MITNKVLKCNPGLSKSWIVLFAVTSALYAFFLDAFQGAPSFWRIFFDVKNTHLYSSNQAVGLAWPAAKQSHRCLLTPTLQLWEQGRE